MQCIHEQCLVACSTQWNYTVATLLSQRVSPSSSFGLVHIPYDPIHQGGLQEAVWSSSIGSHCLAFKWLPIPLSAQERELHCQTDLSIPAERLCSRCKLCLDDWVQDSCEWESFTALMVWRWRHWTDARYPIPHVNFSLCDQFLYGGQLVKRRIMFFTYASMAILKVFQGNIFFHIQILKLTETSRSCARMDYINSFWVQHEKNCRDCDPLKFKCFH